MKLTYIVVTIIMTNTALAINCPARYFYNVKQEQCVQCSLCNSDNEVMKRQCTKTRDAVCGRFSYFKQSGHNQYFLPVVKDTSTETVPKRFTGGYMTDSPPAVFSDEVNHWKTLSLALMGLIVIISIFITVYCIVTCIRRKKRNMIRETEREIDEIYLRARLFSRDRLSTTEYQHTLQDLEEATPSKKRRLKRIYRPRGNFGRGQVVDEVFVAKKDNEKCYSFSKVNEFRLGAIPEINEKLELEKVRMKMRQLSSGDEQCDVDGEANANQDTTRYNALLSKENKTNDIIEDHGDSAADTAEESNKASSASSVET